MMVTPVVFFMDGEYVEKGFEYTVLITTQQLFDESMGTPGIFFFYSFTPYTISVTWKSRSFRSFVISTGAMLAGFYSIFSMIYSHQTRKNVAAKEQQTIHKVDTNE